MLKAVNWVQVQDGLPDSENQKGKGRMVPSGTLRRVALVATDVSEERSAYFISVTRIRELGTLGVTSNRLTLRRFTKIFLCRVRRLLATANLVPSSPVLVTLMKKALSSSETSVLTRAT
jgi:hypothetical protein